MKTGARGGDFKILTDAQAERIHQAALSLLQDPGIFSESDLFLDIFARGGARVDRDARVIRVPSEMVEAALAAAPSSFVLYGRRDPDMDLLLGASTMAWAAPLSRSSSTTIGGSRDNPPRPI